MKVFYLGLILSLFLTGHAFSQENSARDHAPSIILSVGLALGSEHNIGHWGLFVSNELRVGLSKSIALNPRLNYFESLAAVEGVPYKSYSSHSGVFIDFGLSYSFIREREYGFSLNAGPSYQIGNQTRTIGSSFVGDVLVDEQFEHTKIRRFGFYADLEYSWNREEKYLHTVALKTYSFDIYPEFLGLAYKLGFKL